MKVDCIVVGTGAAGVDAGLPLQQHSASFVMLASKSRLGGRSYSVELSPSQMVMSTASVTSWAFTDAHMDQPTAHRENRSITTAT